VLRDWSGSGIRVAQTNSSHLALASRISRAIASSNDLSSFGCGITNDVDIYGWAGKGIKTDVTDSSR